MIEKKYIAPNAITAANMLLGYLSIIASIEGKFVTAVWFVIAAMVCDTLDGKAARKFDAFSEFGKEFDSFSDAISFGLAPGILIYSVLLKDSGMSRFIIPISFIYALCVVMRLVKFNVVTVASTEKDDFSGMPSPCGAALVVGYYLICDSVRKLGFLGEIDLYSHEAFAIIAVVSGILMVSIIPFRTADRVFSFIPKKFFPLFVLFIIVTLKYSLFIFSLFYVLMNLKDFAMSKNLFSRNEEQENQENQD